MRDSTLHQLALQVHLGAGIVALVTFWIQVFRRKAGPWHRRIGWIYATAMALVLISAIPLTLAFWQDGQSLVSMFLGFLGVITLSAGIEAIMASRNRTSDAWTRGPWMIGATALITAYSTVLLVFFATTGAWLFLVMGGIGIWASIDYVRSFRKPPPYLWVARHLEAMMATGIAVHVAFLLFGLGVLQNDRGTLQLAVFVGPIVFFSVLSRWFRRRLVPS